MIGKTHAQILEAAQATADTLAALDFDPAPPTTAPTPRQVRLRRTIRAAFWLPITAAGIALCAAGLTNLPA